jgi:hypothetical protein
VVDKGIEVAIAVEQRRAVLDAAGRIPLPRRVLKFRAAWMAMSRPPISIWSSDPSKRSAALNHGL